MMRKRLKVALAATVAVAIALGCVLLIEKADQRLFGDNRAVSCDEAVPVDGASRARAAAEAIEGLRVPLGRDDTRAVVSLVACRTVIGADMEPVAAAFARRKMLRGTVRGTVASGRLTLDATFASAGSNVSDTQFFLRAVARRHEAQRPIVSAALRCNTRFRECRGLEVLDPGSDALRVKRP